MELLGENIVGGKASLDTGKNEDLKTDEDLHSYQKEQKEIRHEQERWIGAIDSLIEELSGVDDSKSEDHPMEYYLDHTKHKELFDHSHFFDPKNIQELKTEMVDNSEFIFKIKGKHYKLWKPDKLVLTKALRDVFEKAQ